MDAGQLRDELCKLSGNQVQEDRYQRFRSLGAFEEQALLSVEGRSSGTPA